MTSSESSAGWHEIETPELEGIDESEHEDMFLDERKTSKRLGELIKSGSDDGRPSKYLRNYTGLSNYDRVEWCTSWTQRGTETPQEAPKPPRETGSTDWSRYTSYLCRICQDWCLNTKDSKAAETRQCWNCLALPTLEEDGSRTLSVFGPDLPDRCSYDFVEDFGFIERRQEYTRPGAFVIAQRLRLNGEMLHPPADRPFGEQTGSALSETPPQDRDPEAVPLPWGADPEARSQGPTEGTDPTTTKPQRRVSDSKARTDGGRRD